MGRTRKDIYSDTTDEIIQLKLNLAGRAIWGVLSFIIFCPCFYFLVKLIPEIFEVQGGKLFLLLILILCCFLFVIDFPLFLNHFLFEVTRSVILNKTQKILRIERFGKLAEIDLVNDDYKVIRFKPRYNHLEKIPGADYRKIVIIRNRQKFEFSDTILEGSNLWLTLLSLNSKENIREIKRQINFIW